MYFPTPVWLIIKKFLIPDNTILQQNLYKCLRIEDINEFLRVKKVKGRSKMKIKKDKINFIVENYNNEIRYLICNLYYINKFMKAIDYYISYEDAKALAQETIHMSLVEFRLFFNLFDFTITRCMIMSRNINIMNEIRKSTDRLFYRLKYETIKNNVKLWDILDSILRGYSINEMFN